VTTIAGPARSNRQGLAAALRERTRAAHERAESAPFVAALVAGELPLSAYTALVAQNHAIYVTLERHAAVWRGDPVAGRVVFDELTRVPHLRADLRALLGEDWADRADELVVPATRRYTEHLDDVVADWAAGFVAHHYVRYLGDLSGGQILRRSIETVYGDAGRDSTSFYVFDGIERVKPFRDAYRRILDTVPIGVAEQRRAVDEAVVAFELNRAVFDDLARVAVSDQRAG
jgi:heme oxygenase